MTGEMLGVSSVTGTCEFSDISGLEVGASEDVKASFTPDGTSTQVWSIRITVSVLVPWRKEDIDGSTSVGSRVDPTAGVVTAVGRRAAIITWISDANDVHSRHYWYLAVRETSEESRHHLLCAVRRSKVWELGLQVCVDVPKAFEQTVHGS